MAIGRYVNGMHKGANEIIISRLFIWLCGILEKVETVMRAQWNEFKTKLNDNEPAKVRLLARDSVGSENAVAVGVH